MAKNTKEPQINLLPQEEFEASTFGRIIKWLLGTFRYIVIGTEMIVMVAFLSRFWLDAKSNDLIDAINQKKAIIASYSSFETQFRATQDKLKLFSQFANPAKKTSPILEDISSKIPSDVTLSEVSTDGSKIELTASASSESSASQFVTNLNSSTLLSNMAITTVQSKENILIFTIKGTIKGGSNGS